MASQSGIVKVLVALIMVVKLVQADFRLECSMIPAEECAFAVGFTGHRCVLEKVLGTDRHVCKTSDILVGEEAPVEYIETDSCVKACGVDRMSVGFSTEGLSSNSFTSKLCSSECRDNCDNLVDLYSNIVAGEGITLAELCGEQRRSMMMMRNLIAAEAPAYL